MRKINAVTAEYMEMLDNIGINHGITKEFVPSTRATRRWRQCRKLPDSRYSININADLLDERNDVNNLKNTLIHELLHSVDGCMNHGENCKRAANKVYLAYGIDITRSSSAEDKQAVYVRNKAVSTNLYVLECEKCHQMIRRQKMSKAIQHPERYRCRCGGTLKRVQ